jgi:hypothetical protein
MNQSFKVLSLSMLMVAAAGCHSTTSSTASVTAPSSDAAATAPAPSVATSDNDAIKAAIQRHLSTNSGINMSAMDMSVDRISVNGDQAQADVTFRLKQGGTSMLMTYSLQRHAGDWIVVSSQPSGGQFAHPPMDKVHSGVATNPGAGTPAMPDLSEFLKDHPPASKTSP